MKISIEKKAIFEKWENCLMEFYKFGDNTALLKFQNDYPEDFITLRRMNLKRIAIKDSIEPLFLVGEPVYWFTLTFNNIKDSNSVLWKRKEAQAFLNKIAPVYLMVEEYGKTNTKRYHIHGFCVRKYELSEEEFFMRFREWHSRQNIKMCTDLKKGLKKVKYLSKYIVKDVPQLRRSKSMAKLYAYYKSIKNLKRSFPTLFIDRLYDFYGKNIGLELFY